MSQTNMQEFVRHREGRPRARYRNPWHKDNGIQGPKFYETDAVPFEHAGCRIYERVARHVWDVVYAGVCITQLAGRENAKAGAEIAKAHRYYPELRK